MRDIVIVFLFDCYLIGKVVLCCKFLIVNVCFI